MAVKTHGTRQKMTFRVAIGKPRNPLAVLARKRAAGPHQKSASAERAAAERALKRALKKAAGNNES